MTTYTLSSGQTIDAATLNLPSGSIIIAVGNDTLTIENGIAEPEGGNNTVVVPTGDTVQVVYWNSSTGITANLQTGIVTNGSGQTDTLVGAISIFAGSNHDDVIIGATSITQTFAGSSGNDTYYGNGTDIVNYFGESSAGANATYNATTQTWTVIKHFADGTSGTDTIHNVAELKFSDNTLYAQGYLPVSPPTGYSSSNDLYMVAPFYTNNGKTLDFLMLWTVPTGPTSTPLQVLQYNAATSSLSDVTSTIFSGPVPVVDFPNAVVIGDFNGDGRPDIITANFGHDFSPWPGTTSTLLLSTATGQLADASINLPQTNAECQWVSSGLVDRAGDIGIFFNNLKDSPPYYLLSNGTGTFNNKSSSYLPTSLQSVSPAYTASAMTDLNGDGLADLVLGPLVQTQGPPLVYLNPGNGDFSHVTPIILPVSPLPNSTSLYPSLFPGLYGAQIVNILPIHISSSQYNDLIQISTNSSYTAYAIQILINDGSGHFTDQTSSRLLGASSEVINTNGARGPWLLQGYVADINGDGYPDIATQGEQGAPSQVFLNDGAGHFNLVH